MQDRVGLKAGNYQEAEEDGGMEGSSGHQLKCVARQLNPGRCS